MPYKKRYKKRFKKRYQGGNSLSQVSQIANTAFKIAKGVAGLINTEFKYRDVLQTPINPSAVTDNIFLINGIAQGMDNTQRIGRSIKGKYIYYKGTAAHNAAAVSNTVKIYTLVDKKTAGALPSALEMFTIRTELGFRNIDFGERFQILDQKCLELSANHPHLCFESYIDLSNKEFNHTEYDGTGATNADISSYPLYIVVMSSDTVNLATVEINHRYRYIDN